MTSSLQSIINSTFIKRFEGVAAQGRSPLKSSGGEEGGAQAVQVGLRRGAGTYAKAVQGLNAVAGFLNLSQGALQKLGGITDKLIELAGSAVRPGTQKQEGMRLDAQFRKLAAEFKDVVANARFNGREYLTVAGLAELFTTVGLDREKSDEIAALFRGFLTAENDETLASDKMKEKRKLLVPTTVLGPARETTIIEYTMSLAAPDGTVQPAGDGALATSSAAPDTFLAEDASVRQSYPISPGKLAVTRDADGDGIADTISTYRIGSSEFTDLRSGLTVGQFAVLEQAAEGRGFLAYSSAAPDDEADIYLLAEDGTEIARYNSASGVDTVKQLSLADDESGYPELSVYGTLSAVDGSLEDEHYHFSPQVLTETTRTAAGVARQADGIFDGTWHLSNKAEAYRILMGLTALKEQISSNNKVLEEARDLLKSNLELVRATGLALLEMSNQNLKEADADALAADLRDRIRSNARTALTQAENLEPIAVAALVLDSSSFAAANRSEQTNSTVQSTKS